jgi:hypothetical protein
MPPAADEGVNALCLSLTRAINNTGHLPTTGSSMYRTSFGWKPGFSNTNSGRKRPRFSRARRCIRWESHPEPGSYNPRHHGEHYHVEVKPNNRTWNQAKKHGEIQKISRDDYQIGQGTGYLPGERFPGSN